MAIVKSSQESLQLMKMSLEQGRDENVIKEELIKEERMRDVLLLLQNLTEREEATIKLILDCLYDVGAVNLINNKVTFQPLNKFLKSIANKPKGIFRFLGFIWFKRNCPLLITNWLFSQVSFKNKK
jgi:hypothetical protein